MLVPNLLKKRQMLYLQMFAVLSMISHLEIHLTDFFFFFSLSPYIFLCVNLE